MAETIDFYEVLQVHPKAELDVIQAAYRSLARKYHPDLFLGSHERMVAINEAWAVLGNPIARTSYDHRRESPVLAPSSAAPDAGDKAQRATSGPPVGRQTGTVLDFGRYAGWSFAQILQHDPDFLEWLVRTPIGRPFRLEIGALLAARPEASPFPTRQPRRRRMSFGR